MLWSDSLSRRSYAVFGDILSFNTTHKINRYSMVFALLTGLSHHRHLIYFGTGLLRDEKLESFQCQFNSFLIVMGSHMPKTMITSQDLAIRQTVADVFESSIPRFCMLHIMRKLPERVGCTLNGWEEFIEHIKGCVWASNSPYNFEEYWGADARRVWPDWQ